jgi:hypothetical protein
MEQRKQVIRLTEQDLHNIITESVKQALNELDWKTYSNATRAQADRLNAKYARDGEKYADYDVVKDTPEYERCGKFARKRNQAFADKYTDDHNRDAFYYPYPRGTRPGDYLYNYSHNNYE